MIVCDHDITFVQEVDHNFDSYSVTTGAAFFIIWRDIVSFRMDESKNKVRGLKKKMRTQKVRLETEKLTTTRNEQYAKKNSEMYVTG